MRETTPRLGPGAPHRNPGESDLNHSVTCVVCGELTDEREAIPCWRDDHSVDPAMWYDSITAVATIAVIIARYGPGEVDAACYDAVRAEVIGDE